MTDAPRSDTTGKDVLRVVLALTVPAGAASAGAVMFSTANGGPLPTVVQFIVMVLVMVTILAVAGPLISSIGSESA